MQELKANQHQLSPYELMFGYHLFEVDVYGSQLEAIRRSDILKFSNFGNLLIESIKLYDVDRISSDIQCLILCSIVENPTPEDNCNLLEDGN